MRSVPTNGQKGVGIAVFGWRRLFSVTFTRFFLLRVALEGVLASAHNVRLVLHS